ncbi:MAG: enoyl-CoA hydratase/isomerase family protein [Burkholderiaceae bacterium]|nr:enoyl-CoA hydratase/isomerase family protein [Burkholderiaceae bacterium]
MSSSGAPTTIGIEREGHLTLIELRKPPYNFFDQTLLTEIADAVVACDEDPDCRVILLAAQGKAFCAGADFSSPREDRNPSRRGGAHPLYAQAVRMFRAGKPIVAAVQGPAIGGGLGLALVADFRIACPEARFSANFTRLGFHPGFGLSVTLPRLVGMQEAARLLYTGRRIDGAEAQRIGLVDDLVPADELRARARALATEIAISAPIAVQATRASLRAGLADAVQAATDREAELQARHFQTEDFREGVAAMAERRDPAFKGR